MSNALYGKGKEKFGGVGGSLTLLSDTIKAALLSSAYTPNLATHEWFSDISAYVLGTPQTLGSKSFTLGVFDAADPTWPAVPGGNTASYIAIYKDTGVAGTSPLIALFDTITGFPLGTNGGNIQIVWDNGAAKIISL